MVQYIQNNTPSWSDIVAKGIEEGFAKQAMAAAQRELPWEQEKRAQEEQKRRLETAKSLGTTFETATPQVLEQTGGAYLMPPEEQTATGDLFRPDSYTMKDLGLKQESKNTNMAFRSKPEEFAKSVIASYQMGTTYMDPMTGEEKNATPDEAQKAYDALLKMRSRGSNPLQQQRFELQQTQAQEKALSKLEQNKIMNDATERQRRIDNGASILQSAVITPTMMNEVSLDIGALISGSSGLSDERARQVEAPTLQKKYSEYLQLYSSSPQHVNTPEMQNLFKDILQRMDYINRKTVEDAYTRLASPVERTFQNYPSVMGGISERKKTLGEATKKSQETLKSLEGPAQTQVINGVTYQKVPGGWQRVK